MDYTRLFEHIARCRITKSNFRMLTGLSQLSIDKLYDNNELSLENLLKVCNGFRLQPYEVSEDATMTLQELTEMVHYVTTKDKVERWNARLQADIEKSPEINHTKVQQINEPRKKTLAQYTLDGELMAEFYDPRDAEAQTGISHSSIYRVLSGKRNNAGGYTWKNITFLSPSSHF